MDTSAEIVKPFWITAIVVLLLVIGIASFILLYQRKLMLQRMEMSQKTKLYEQRLLESVIEVQEKERIRIARDLHDGAGAALSGAIMGLKQFIRKATLSEAQQDHMEILQQMLVEGIETIRTASHDLALPALLDKGLFVAIREMTDRMNTHFSGEIFFEGLEGESYSALEEKHLYRIVQELYQNGLKHAQATKISLRIYREEAVLCLLYEDNGIGISASSEKGLGTESIDSRVKLLKGTWEVDYSIKKGCRILMKLNEIKNRYDSSSNSR